MMISRSGRVIFGRRAFGRPRRTCGDASKIQTLTDDITKRVDTFYKQNLEPIDNYHLIPTERSTLPLVLLLGNHSSGKSTFINYLLHQKEQDTGVAPTDDGFTIICHSHINADEDGPTVVGNPQWGFSELATLPKAFVNHLRLKQRVLDPSALLPEGMMIVDTPGMIDTASKEEQHLESRGYNFLQAVKWFAERADVVLLLFDPDKPGTTGETLQVLTESLVDLEHKVLLVMNKVDQFQKVHDFARAYGSLCWNLSKVIHRKDLPRIFTMFTPTSASARGQEYSSLTKRTETTLSPADARVTAGDTSTHDPYATSHIPLSDFNHTRDEVIGEITKAPHKRVDNIVTQLSDSIDRVVLVSEMHNAVVKAYSKYQRKHVFAGAMAMGATGTVFAASAWVGLPWYLVVVATAGAGVPTGLGWYQSAQNIANLKTILMGGLDKTFRDMKTAEMMTDGDLKARWARLKPRFVAQLKHQDLSKLRAIKGVEALRKQKAKLISDLRLQCNVVRELVSAPNSPQKKQSEEE
eukprot:TRINITY_DN22045_c0_g1_i1.p1 TRINITY_DN22045_c0_g1~~TRINITY_DN22045_c0_g1_i1.p1  ORF type:complete len:523 (-),score=49.76 TRINITY_DN22045_c0_g1_i1:852-2420(-)